MPKLEGTQGVILEDIPGAIQNVDSNMKKPPTLTPTLPYQFPLPGYFVFIAPPGSGKGFSGANLLRDYFKTGMLNRMFVMSPTFLAPTNHHLNSLPYNADDVYTNDIDKPGKSELALTSILGKMKESVDQFLAEEEYRKCWRRVKAGSGDLRDRIVLQRENNRPPRHIPEPRFILLVDDMSHTAMMNSKVPHPFNNLSLRHRHLFGQDDRAFGLTIMVMVQTFRNGVPPSLRDTAKVVFLWGSEDTDYVKMLYQHFGAKTSYEQFAELYAEATKDEHSFLTIDKINKDRDKRFRKNLNQYIRPKVRLKLTEILFKRRISDAETPSEPVTEEPERKRVKYCKRR